MKAVSHKQYSLFELTQGLNVTIQGDPDCLIEGVCTIQDALPGHVTFLVNPLYRKYLATTQAAAVILSPEEAENCPVNAVVSTNPYFTYAQVARYFLTSGATQSGIHPSAVVGEGCHIHPSAIIQAHSVLGNQVTIGANVVIGANTTIGDHTVIGANTIIDANVAIYYGVTIGERVRIASGVVIGSDGFGFANQQGVWHKIPQLGSVIIGNDVDIGANTTIDRGAIENTVIEEGVKLDNQIQIGHNVHIGAHTLISGCTAISGSTTIGKHCLIGGASCFAGHITVADKVMITGMTAVTKSIKEPGIYSSGIVGAVPNQEFRKNNARFHRLENLMQRVKELESSLKKLTEGQP
jgi:UDP-3-O-[3-hydroxymyristoyl] glucosamine N-acyltransferase